MAGLVSGRAGRGAGQSLAARTHFPRRGIDRPGGNGREFLVCRGVDRLGGSPIGADDFQPEGRECYAAAALSADAGGRGGLAKGAVQPVQKQPRTAIAHAERLRGLA